jgi:hypothetical protein
VRWLEDFRDETERRVREALDVAATRNDDLALRRVWSRLADLIPQAGQSRRLVRGGLWQRLRWSVLLTVAGLGVAGIAGVALIPPLLRQAPHRWPSTISATTSAKAPPGPRIPATGALDLAPSGSSAVPVPVEADSDPTPFLVGPATVQTGAREARAVRLKSGARIDLRSRTTLSIDAGQRPVLRRGRARLVVPKQPPDETFSVAAGPYVVVVVGTKFNLGVTSRRVEVDVREGVVEVWRGGGHVIRLHAGGSWKGPVRGGSGARRRPGLTKPRRGPGAGRGTSLAAVGEAPPAAGISSPSAAYQEAQAALARNDTMIGLAILRQVAASKGPSAENAAFLIGRVQRDGLSQPRQAIMTWNQYRNRFPDGLLRHEADLNIIETLLDLGDTAAARPEIAAFLERHPNSERSAKLRAIAATLATQAAPSN